MLVLVGLVWAIIRNNDNKNPSDTKLLPDSAMDTAQSADNVLNLEFTDINGRKVKLKEFAGKPMIVNAWATWCPFCVEELEAFAEVKAEFGDSIEVIAVDRAEPVKTAKTYIEKLAIKDDLIWLLDPKDSLYKTIGGFSMPETLFIKADGTINFHKRGPMTVDEIRDRVQELLP